MFFILFQKKIQSELFFVFFDETVKISHLLRQVSLFLSHQGTVFVVLGGERFFCLVWFSSWNLRVIIFL
jgi:hypothetical protein